MSTALVLATAVAGIYSLLTLANIVRLSLSIKEMQAK